MPSEIYLTVNLIFPGADDVLVKFDYNKEDNTTRHHTDEYENNVLVLRRGDIFTLGLTFENVGESHLQESLLQFSIGKLAFDSYET